MFLQGYWRPPTAGYCTACFAEGGKAPCETACQEQTSPLLPRTLWHRWRVCDRGWLLPGEESWQWCSLELQYFSWSFHTFETNRWFCNNIWGIQQWWDVQWSVGFLLRFHLQIPMNGLRMQLLMAGLAAMSQRWMEGFKISNSFHVPIEMRLIDFGLFWYTCWVPGRKDSTMLAFLGSWVKGCVQWVKLRMSSNKQ